MFYLYDHGYQIQTPVRSILPGRMVEQVTQSLAARPTREEGDTLALLGQSTPPGGGGGGARGNRAKQAYESTLKSTRRSSDQPDLTVAKIMSTPVVTTQAGSLMTEAWDLMVHYQIKHLPVQAADGRLLGVITERDLLLRNSQYSQQVPLRTDLTIEGSFSAELIVATLDTTIRQAALMLFDRRLSCLPIVNREGRLAGIVTLSDMLPLLIHDHRFNSLA